MQTIVCFEVYKNVYMLMVFINVFVTVCFFFLWASCCQLKFMPSFFDETKVQITEETTVLYPKDMEKAPIY